MPYGKSEFFDNLLVGLGPLREPVSLQGASESRLMRYPLKKNLPPRNEGRRDALFNDAGHEEHVATILGRA